MLAYRHQNIADWPWNDDDLGSILYASAHRLMTSFLSRSLSLSFGRLFCHETTDTNTHSTQ